MNRFLQVKMYRDTWNTTNEVQEKIPRPPNGFMWCVRKLGFNGLRVATGSGTGAFFVYNDKSADVPISGVSRKVIGSLSMSWDDTNKVLYKEPDKDFPRGSILLNDYYLTGYFYAATMTFSGTLYVILELIHCSAIEQLKSDLLNSD